MGLATKMDCGQTLAAEEPESSWSENTTPDSDDIEEIVRQQDDRDDDHHEHDIYRPRPPPSKDLASYPRYMRPAIRRRLNTGERADRSSSGGYHVATVEVRRSMDGSEGSSAASNTSNLTIVTASSASSCTDPYSSSGFVEEEHDEPEPEMEPRELNWDDPDEDMLLVPKLEPLDDDDVDMADVSVRDGAVPETPSQSASTSPVAAKRPRGRPRKHPKVSPDSVVKTAKGRSKTGCITCRKRKKKCDEAKPGCEYLGWTFFPPRG